MTSVHGGTISDFASTGIDDNATSTQVTITDTVPTMAGNAIITGDLTVNGTLTSISTTNTEIADNSIVLNKGETAPGVTARTAGIEIDRGTEDLAISNGTKQAIDGKLKSALLWQMLQLKTHLWTESQ